MILSENKRNRLQTVVVFSVLLFMTIFMIVMIGPNPWFNIEPQTDAGVFRYIGWRMTLGEMPYRDTFDHKGPLLYIINAAGMQISSQWGVWLIEIVFIFFSFCLMYRIGRLFTERFYALFGTVAAGLFFAYYDVGGNSVEEYAVPFIALGLYVFLDYFKNQRTTWWKLMLCGISFGVVFLLRPNMTGVWIVMCIGVLIQCIQKRTWGNLLFYLGLFIFGAVIVIAPIMIWLIVNHAFHLFIEEYFLFNAFYIHMSSDIIQKIRIFFLFLLHFQVFFALFFSVFIWKNEKTFLSGIYIVCMIMCNGLAAMSGRYYEHYLISMVPLLVYPCSYGLLSLLRRLKPDYRIYVVTAFVSVLVLMPGLFYGEAGLFLHVNRSKYEISDDLKTVVQYIDSHTDADDLIQVCGNRDVIYCLSNRRSASFYSYQEPIIYLDQKIRTDFLDDIREDKPKIVILEMRKNSYRLRSWVEETVNSCHYKEVDTGQKTFMVYQLSD